MPSRYGKLRPHVHSCTTGLISHKAGLVRGRATDRVARGGADEQVEVDACRLEWVAACHAERDSPARRPSDKPRGSRSGRQAPRRCRDPPRGTGRHLRSKGRLGVHSRSDPVWLSSLAATPTGVLRLGHGGCWRPAEGRHLTEIELVAQQILRRKQMAIHPSRRQS
jgi:hypothetical protein